jgi:hypothetical protein
MIFARRRIGVRNAGRFLKEIYLCARCERLFDHYIDSSLSIGCRDGMDRDGGAGGEDDGHGVLVLEEGPIGAVD